MQRNMAESNKHNLMAAAYECGSRLERRQENILTAFTYGKKIRYEDLDDANYQSALIQKNKSKTKKQKKKHKKRTHGLDSPFINKSRATPHTTNSNNLSPNSNNSPVKSLHSDRKKSFSDSKQRNKES